MKKYSLSLLVLTVVLAAGFPATSQAQTAPDTAAKIRPPRPALTQAQIAEIKTRREADRAAASAQQAQMKSVSDQLRAEMQKKPVDRNKVDGLRKQMELQLDIAHLQQMQAMANERPDMKPADKQRYEDMIQKTKDRIAREKTAK